MLWPSLFSSNMVMFVKEKGHVLVVTGIEKMYGENVDDNTNSTDDK